MRARLPASWYTFDLNQAIARFMCHLKHAFIHYVSEVAENVLPIGSFRDGGEPTSRSYDHSVMNRTNPGGSPESALPGRSAHG